MPCYFGVVRSEAGAGSKSKSRLAADRAAASGDVVQFVRTPRAARFGSSNNLFYPPISIAAIALIGIAWDGRSRRNLRQKTHALYSA